MRVWCVVIEIGEGVFRSRQPSNRRVLFVGSRSSAGQHNGARSRKKIASPNNLNLIATASSATAAAAATTLTAAFAATASPVASSASGVFSLRSRFIHVESASAHLRAIQCGNGLVPIFVAGHLHKTESARASGIAVRHDTHPVHLTERCKHLS